MNYAGSRWHTLGYADDTLDYAGRRWHRWHTLGAAAIFVWPRHLREDVFVSSVVLLGHLQFPAPREGCGLYNYVVTSYEGAQYGAFGERLTGETVSETLRSLTTMDPKVLKLAISAFDRRRYRENPMHIQKFRAHYS